MPDETGERLERNGHETLTRLGLHCVRGRRQALLRRLDPGGIHGPHDNIELDYLIPVGRFCAIGEITARSENETARKYRSFVGSLHLLKTIIAQLQQRRSAERDAFWQQLGVLATEAVAFRDVEEVRGFFVTPGLDKYDLRLDPAEQIARFYKADWKYLVDYAEAVGSYGQPMFLHTLGIPTGAVNMAIQVGRRLAAPGLRAVAPREHSSPDSGLARTPAKKIAGGSITPADVFTFEASPYELLPAARVLRRDQLPDLGSGSRQNYQRPLIKSKLEAIRTNLLVDADFMFPSNILVVLGAGAEYRAGQLTIPQEYGSINVIDGQHRLFSYANGDIHAIQSAARISVMAVMFETDDPEAIERHSAQIFIETNTNQTPVRPAHIHAIAYPILGHKDATSLCAQMLIRVNERGGALYGMLDVNQDSVGVIQPLTLLAALKRFLNPARLQNVSGALRGTKFKRRKGYESLIGSTDLAALAADPEEFIVKGTSCVGRFFDEVARVFPHDFPTRKRRAPPSAFKHAKVIAALIRLLNEMSDEGADWDAVRSALLEMRSNVLTVREAGANTHVVFREGDPDVPDATHRQRQDFQFLNANRTRPTSISEIT